MSTLILDGDIFLFEACMASEKEVRWDEHLHTLHSNLEEVQDIVMRNVSRLANKLDAHKVIFALSCPKEDRFRPRLMPTYKSNRVDARKPLAYKSAREWAKRHFDSREWPGCEGDDVLGVLATSGRYDDPIMVSNDKDLFTIPGKLYRPMNDELHETSEVLADLFWMKQTLMGDKTDGYDGIPGVGPKTADKILEQARGSLGDAMEPLTPENLWPFVVAAYAAKGLGESIALQNARMARILRYGDYNLRTQEVFLWEPSFSVASLDTEQST